MKTRTLSVVIIALLLIASCSKKPTALSSSGPASVFSRYFPGIDTCHMWLTSNYKPTAMFAKITSTTYAMTIHGIYPYPTGDNYIIHFTDSIPDTMGNR